MPSVLRAQGAPVKLGVLHPVTGALSYSGQQGRLGAMMAIEEINAAGGVKGLGKIDAVLGGSVSADEYHRNIPAIFLGQFGIQIDIHLAQMGVEFAEQWREDGFSLVAEVATGPRVHGDFQSVGCSESRGFRGDAHGFGCENLWKDPACG